MVVLGLMSGTSLDGVDLALVTIDEVKDSLNYTILESATIPYPDVWYEKLKCAHDLDLNSLKKLSENYGLFLAETIQAFLKTTSIQPDIIASHGHTVLHQPEEGITIQIGNGPEIHRVLNIPVVCDFRVQDVELGGQGAPLVPIGDRLLFSDYDCCVNLGGFINLSFEQDGKRVAYDVCPMNIVMNDLAAGFGVNYDDGGKLAKSGLMNEELLEKLNALDYYSQSAPKSLGKEWVIEMVWPLLKGSNPKDALCTFVEHAAQQLANNINGASNVLLTGGGVYNTFFIERLKHHSNSVLVIPNKDIIEYKEALIFALLGFLRWNKKVNVFSSVTGASRDHSSGVVYK